MAIGEALGAPLEGMTQKEIEEKVERITGYLDPKKLQPEHRAAQLRRGVYEDDTQTAIAAAEILIRNRGWSVENLRDRLGELGQQIPGKVFGCYRRPHRNLRTAVRRMIGGSPWQECGINSAGASGVSRGIPIGIWFRDDRDAMLRAAVESTLLTHRDPRPCAATASLAAVVAEVVKLGDAKADPSALAKVAIEAAKDAEALITETFADLMGEGYENYRSQFSDTISSLEELVELDLEPALARIVEVAADRASRPITTATKGFCLTAVPAALYFFLTGLDNYPDTVVDTIAEGGSSDTLGCLVGGLAGALHGAEGIPPRWVEGLRNGDQIDLRGALLAEPDDLSEMSPLLLMEAQLTPKAPDQKKRAKPGPEDRRGGARGGPGAGRGGRGGPPRGGGGPRRGPGGGGGGRGRPGGGDRRPAGAGAGRGGGGGGRGRPGGRPGGGGGGGRPGGGGRGGPPGRGGDGRGPGGGGRGRPGGGGGGPRRGPGGPPRGGGRGPGGGPRGPGGGGPRGPRPDGDRPAPRRPREEGDD